MKKNQVNTRTYTKQFYKGNKIYFVIALSMVLIEVLSTLTLSWLIQQLLDLNGGNNTGFSLIDLIMIALMLIVVSIVISAIEYFTKPKFITQGISQYKEYIFKELTKKNIFAFSEENTSKYISALTNDIPIIEQGYLRNVFTVVECVLTFCGAMVLMLWYSPLLTVIAMAFSMLPLIASILTGNKVIEVEKGVSDQNEIYTTTLQDCLGGFSVIKSFQAEKQMIHIFNNNVKKLANIQCKKQKIMILVQMFGTVAGVVAQLGVFIFGVYFSLTGSDLTAGKTMVFVQLMNFVISPIVTIPSCIAERKAAKALIKKIAEDLNVNIRKQEQTKFKTFDGGIEVRNLTFGYSPEQTVLNNINYFFECGKKYVIVGASGCGKSTLLNLLMGSHLNYEGTICYDETELREIHSSNLYEIASIIQQNVFVFNATIRENITMFREFSEEQISAAIKISGLSKVIEEKGKDYLCGENGGGLSGGEKQRISIARALLKHAQILLVDEATSALDAETAYQVSKAILELDRMTSITVTHMLDEKILSQYDDILVLKNGELIENGTFEKLIAEKGYFYSLYTMSQ